MIKKKDQNIKVNIPEKKLIKRIRKKRESKYSTCEQVV